MRKLRWTIGIVLGVLVVGYLVGGTEGYAQFARNIRARVGTMLEPPTQVEMQRAAARGSLDNQTMTVAIERARMQMPLGRPASRAHVAGVIGGVLVASFGLMFVTGRNSES